MKLLNFFILIFLILTIIVACNKESDLRPIEQNTSVNFIDNKDSLTFRQEFWDRFQRITPCEARAITFFIDNNCIGTPYQNAIFDAVVAYNNVNGSSLQFNQTNSQGDADLVFDCVTGDGCGEAIASPPFPANIPGFPNTVTTFPSGGTIGGLIHLEIGWTSCPCTEPGCNFVGFEPPCMFQRTVMHEIAHTLGLAHNDDVTGTNVPGTPNVNDDPNSVFNSGPTTFGNCDWCDAPCVFNANDITAIQFLYPVGSTAVLCNCLSDEELDNAGINKCDCPNPPSYCWDWIGGVECLGVDCPSGYECLDGDCIESKVCGYRECPCRGEWACPPGHTCINKYCVPY